MNRTYILKILAFTLCLSTLQPALMASDTQTVTEPVVQTEEQEQPATYTEAFTRRIKAIWEHKITQEISSAAIGLGFFYLAGRMCLAGRKEALQAEYDIINGKTPKKQTSPIKPFSGKGVKLGSSSEQQYTQRAQQLEASQRKNLNTQAPQTTSSNCPPAKPTPYKPYAVHTVESFNTDTAQ